VRSIIRSTSQLSELRASVRRDVAIAGDDDVLIDDFVTAVNEVAAACLSSCVSDAASIDVRWIRRTHPRAELWAEVRNTAGTPTSLLGEGIISRVLHHTAERVDVQERLGGSVITVRSRV
jgi:hypothetical protein